MITMITAEEANELRDKHTEIIKSMIKDIEFEIKKKSMEVDSEKEVRFNIVSCNEIVIGMVIEILKAHNYKTDILKDKDIKILQITWK